MVRATTQIRSRNLEQLLLFAYLGGCFSGGGLENLAEIRGGTEHKAAADLLYGQICGGEQSAGFVAKDLLTNLHGGLIQLFAELQKESAFTDTAIPGYLGYSMRAVGLHIGKRPLYYKV